MTKTTTDGDTPDASATAACETGCPLTPQAQRALAEADQRRRAAAEQQLARPPELGGRNGPEPTRYGDWEKGGIVSDF